jgi:helix-turn-helix protein
MCSIPKLGLTIDEACTVSTLGKTSLRGAIASGELAVSRHGDRVIIEPDELRRFIRSKRTRAGVPVVETDGPADAPVLDPDTSVDVSPLEPEVPTGHERRPSRRPRAELTRPRAFPPTND